MSQATPNERRSPALVAEACLAHGMADVERSWLYVVRDGLLYRSAMYRTQGEARNEYASRGPTLGVT